MLPDVPLNVFSAGTPGDLDGLDGATIITIQPPSVLPFRTRWISLGSANKNLCYSEGHGDPGSEPFGFKSHHV